MRFLVMGSLNYDYTYFVNHIVRPGETIASARLEMACGGKGFNQAAALAKAGGRRISRRAGGGGRRRSFCGRRGDMV